MQCCCGRLERQPHVEARHGRARPAQQQGRAAAGCDTWMQLAGCVQQHLLGSFGQCVTGSVELMQLQHWRMRSAVCSQQHKLSGEQDNT